MDLQTMQKKLKKLRENREELTKRHLKELANLNDQIAQCVSYIKFTGTDSQIARMVRTEPYFSISKEATPQQIRKQIDYLADGNDGWVENIKINISDTKPVLEDMIFYLEKILEGA